MTENIPSVIDSIAENIWLKAVARLAMPILLFLGGLLYTDLSNLKLSIPVLIERINNLEEQTSDIDARVVEARTSRFEQYRLLSVAVSELNQQVIALDKTLIANNAMLRYILASITRRSGQLENQP